MPPIDPTLTIRPPPRRMSGRNAWIMATGPNRLTSSCVRKSAIGWNSRGAGLPMPALLTRPARPRSPTTSVTAAAAAAIVASSVTSMISGVSRRRGLRLQRLTVRLTPNAGEDVEPLPREVQRRCGADPGRRARDDDEAAIRFFSSHRLGLRSACRHPCHRPHSASRAGGDCVQHAVERALREQRDQPPGARHDRPELDVPRNSGAAAR